MKGKSNKGGQSIGNLDIYSLISLDSPAIMKELMTLRSDDFRSKRKVISSIEQTGKAEMPSEVGKGNTSQLKDTYMTVLGLETSI